MEAVASEFFPLGLRPDQDLADGQAALAWSEGDRFYFFSDGYSECENEAGEPFGEAAMVNLLTAGGNEPDLREVWQAVARHLGSEDFRDDLTLVELRP